MKSNALFTAEKELPMTLRQSKFCILLPNFQFVKGQKYKNIAL